ATENAGPEGRLTALNMRAALAAGHGQFRQLRALTQKAQDTATQIKLQEAAAEAEAQRAIWEALAGFRPSATEAASRALKTEPPTTVSLNAAMALALLRQDDRALKIADEQALLRPFDTLVQFVSIPSIK